MSAPAAIKDVASERPDRPAEQPLFKQGMTMPEILLLMQQIDDGLVDLSIDQMKDLASASEVKVDSYKYMIDKFDAEAARLAIRINEFQKAKSALERKARSLEQLLFFHMDKNQFQRLPGKDYVAEIKESTKASVITTVEASPQLYVQYMKYMRVTYEWDKNAMYGALRDKADAELTKIAKLEKSKKLKFDVNRGAAHGD